MMVFNNRGSYASSTGGSGTLDCSTVRTLLATCIAQVLPVGVTVSKFMVLGSNSTPYWLSPLQAGVNGGGSGASEWIPVLPDANQYTIPTTKRLLEIKFFDSVNNAIHQLVGTTPGGNDIADLILPQNVTRYVETVNEWTAPTTLYFIGQSSATLGWIRLENKP